jgi:hypothetical protein
MPTWPLIRTSAVKPARASHVLRRIHTEPVLDDLTLTPLFLSEVVSIAAAGKEIPNTKMGVLREVVHLPEADPTHRGALGSPPLSGQGDAYLTMIASVMTRSSCIGTGAEPLR